MDTPPPLERLLVHLFHDVFCREKGLDGADRLLVPLVDFLDWLNNHYQVEAGALLEATDTTYTDWEELAGVCREPRLDVLAPFWMRVLAARTQPSKARLRGIVFITMLKFTDGGMTRLQTETTTKDPEGLDERGATGAFIALVRELIKQTLRTGLDRLRDEDNAEWPHVLDHVRAAFKAYEPRVPVGQLAAYNTIVSVMTDGLDPEPDGPGRFQPGPFTGGPGGWGVPS